MSNMLGFMLIISLILLLAGVAAKERWVVVAAVVMAIWSLLDYRLNQIKKERVIDGLTKEFNSGGDIYCKGNIFDSTRMVVNKNLGWRLGVSKRDGGESILENRDEALIANLNDCTKEK